MPTRPADSRNPPARSRWAALVRPALLLLLAPLLLAVALYRLTDVDPSPAPFPPDYSFGASIAVPELHDGVLAAVKRIGEARAVGPEDLAYDAAEKMLYASCSDGWIKRVRLDGGDAPPAGVEDWARTGGRPLGVSFDAVRRRLFVADADRGLMMVDEDKMIELLTDEAEGVKFGITDGADVAADGVIYFTDASYKYSLDKYKLDILEARPYGRLLSFDPSTNLTAVLVRNLHFANGVAVAPDQESVVFCETPMRRCRRYHIKGRKKGTIESFIENLPGLPDNIKLDADGDRYWIGLSMGRTPEWDIAARFPIIRKMAYVLEKLGWSLPARTTGSGLLSVAADGKLLTLYTNKALGLTTGGLRVGKYLYISLLEKPYIGRIDLARLLRILCNASAHPVSTQP